uniref:Neutral amino acid transporter 9 n=1 Tax=Callorhinchus milii TaxID=7868 RepID=A0A4W3K8G2_CALMI
MSDLHGATDPQERVTPKASAMNSRIQYYNRLTSTDQTLMPPKHVIPPSEEIYVYSPLGRAMQLESSLDGVGTNSSMVTIFAIWNTMMGTSILSIPWAMKQAGFTLGIILIILMGLLLLYCCYRVVKSRNTINFVDTSSWEFIDVCKYYFGSFGQWSSLLFSMISLIGAMVVYWVLMSNFLFNTGKFLYSTISVIYLIVLVTLKAVRSGFHLEFHWFESVNNFVAEFRLSFPQLTGVLTLAFFFHNSVITLLKNNQDQKNNVRDLSIAYLLVAVTYLYVGIMVFAAFPSPELSKECIEPNFLDNLPSNDVMAFIARVFLLFQMTTVYPLLGYLVRVQLLVQLFGKVYPSFLHVFILNLLIICTGVLVARFYPNIGGLIRYSGATCGLAFVFVYPSLVHMISLKRQRQLKWSSIAFHSLIMVLGLANFITQFFM